MVTARELKPSTALVASHQTEERDGAMGVRDWFSDRLYELEQRVDDFNNRIAERLQTLKAATVATLRHRAFPGWLNLFVAVIAAAGGWFSFLAADRSAQVATEAQAFSVRLARDQVLMARPVLTIQGGTLEVVRDGQDLRQYLQLTVRNSGGRPALPAWVALYDAGDLSDRRSLHTVARRRDLLDVEVPSESEVKVVFPLPRYSSASWAIALAYGDDLAGVLGDGVPTEELGLWKRCTFTKLLLVRAAKPLAGREVAVAEVSPGQPVILNFRDRATRGLGGAEAMAVDLNAVVNGDPRCKK